MQSTTDRENHRTQFVRPLCYRRASVTLALLLSLTAATSHALELAGSLKNPGAHYVPPLSNPLFNETPYITTEARPIFLRQEIPDKFLTNGGDITIVALELRMAITERFGLIASKDGYADIDFDSVLPDDTGFANISIGGKFALLSDPASNTMITAGIEYEAPTGNLRTNGISLQGDGDGFLDVFVSGAKKFGKFGLEGNVGVNFAIDDDHDTSMFHMSGHLDYDLGPFYPLIEINAFVPVSDGSRLPVDFEGIDLVNFGATDSDTIVTFALGGRFKINQHIMIGAGYEQPFSGDEDIMDYRLYLDAVLMLR